MTRGAYRTSVCSLPAATAARDACSPSPLLPSLAGSGYYAFFLARADGTPVAATSQAKFVFSFESQRQGLLGGEAPTPDDSGGDILDAPSEKSMSRVYFCPVADCVPVDSKDTRTHTMHYTFFYKGMENFSWPVETFRCD